MNKNNNCRTEITIYFNRNLGKFKLNVRTEIISQTNDYNIYTNSIIQNQQIIICKYRKNAH